MSVDVEQATKYSNPLRVGGAIAALGLVAACQGGAETTARPSPSASFSNSPTALPSSEFPSIASPANTGLVPSNSPNLENCDSFRSVQPGYYFNKRYSTNIQDQLELMHVAFSAGSNVDIDHDAKRYVLLLHAMENDPEYTDAMHEARDAVMKNPSRQITVNDFLHFPVIIPAECAPHRVSNADSERQLMETQDVALTVGHAMLHHLQEQGSRAVKWFSAVINKELNKIDDTN
ncbi:MAG TPA: hypothetical protein VFI84_04220, partial [Candidatus Saccharimonadales bacterium]|nr:hypothetical protein [Candidatus Saccharimonadales bacterium]